MNNKVENGVLTIFVSGRVDSSNAEAFQKDVFDTIESSAAHESIVLDAEELEYISSAGLRVLLRLRQTNPTLKIINVTSEVYEIFEMTGFSEIINIEKAYRKFSVDGCKVIGKGAKGTVYRYNGDTIVKVYNNPDSLDDIQRERDLARKAFVLGIPTAISYDVVKVGNSFGSVFELLDAKSFSQLIAEDTANMETYVKKFADLLKLIHTTQVRKDDMPDVKGRIIKWAKTAAPFLDDAAAAKLLDLINNVPDTLNMLHCDYHTNNVMLQNGETLLIDMDTISHGHPVFELANVYITYVGFGEVDPTNVESFLGVPYETAIKVWDIFIKEYLGTDDANRIAEVEKKVKALSEARLIHHVARRLSAEEAANSADVKKVAENLTNALADIDTFEF